MGNISLSDEDRQKLLQALNDESEPPAEIAEKLFPRLFVRLQNEARFDAHTLQRAKIPTIEYEGKRSEAAILSFAVLFGGQSPLQLVRCFDEGRLNKKTNQLMLIKESGSTYDTGWRNLIVQGDNLQFLKTCYSNQDPLVRDKVKGKIKLVYIDPPFATRSDFEATQGEDSYADRIDRAEFLEQLRERLILIKALLAEDGSLYVHLDQRMSHYVKVILDEVFGRAAFANAIEWHYSGWNKKLLRGFEKRHDTLLFYTN
jgi:hypothetical protein